MSKAKTFWEQARERYAKEIENTKDRQAFEASFDPKRTPEEFIEAVKEARSNRSDSKTAKALDTLDSLLTPLRELAPVFDVLTQMNSMIGAAIWGPLKLVITVLQRRSDALEMLADMIGLLVTNAQRYLAYEKVHGDSTMVREVLVNFYFDMIDFCARAVRYFGDNMLRRIVRGLGKGFGDEFKQVKKSMERHAGAVDMSAMAAEMEKAATERRDAKTERTEQMKIRQTERERDVRRWLSPGDYSKREHIRRKKDRVDGTCSWILEHGFFKSWISEKHTDDKRLLWIHGKPGAGKSMIASAIVNELQSAGKPHLYFFYNGKVSSDTHAAPLAFAKACVFGMLDILPAAIDIVNAEMHNSGDPRASSFEAVWDLFRQCLKRRQEPVFCLVDAVDECTECEALTESIIEMVSEEENIRFCVISRPHSDIRKKIMRAVEDRDLRLAEIQVATERVCNDIDQYLRAKILKSRILRSAGIIDHVSELAERAGGMFMWARLMLEELEKSKTPNDRLEKLMKTMPEGLDSIYDAIFRRLLKMNNNDQQRLHKILTWLFKSNWRSNLTVDELNVALAIRWEEKDLDRGNMLERPKDDILSLSSPLVEILQDNTVQIVHLSVIEYCIQHPGAFPASFAFSEQRMAMEMATDSLTLLSYETYSVTSLFKPYEMWKKKSCGGTDSKDATSLELFEYAAENWWKHCKSAVESRTPADELLRLSQHMIQFLQSDKSLVWFDYLSNKYGSHSYFAELNFALDCFETTDEPKRGVSTLLRNLAERLHVYMIRTYGEDHYIVTRSLQSLLIVLLMQDDSHAYAEEVALKLLEKRKSTLGEEHEKTLSSMEFLMYNYMCQGSEKLEEAMELNSRLLNIHKRIFGDRHPYTLQDMHNLAVGYVRQGRYPEAEALGAQLLKTRTEIYGENSLLTSKAMIILAYILGQQRRWEEAQKLHSQAVQYYKTKLGPLHPDTIKETIVLAQFYTSNGQHSVAESLFVSALDSYRSLRLNQEHDDILGVMRDLRRNFEKQRKIEKALNLQEDILVICKKKYGGDVPSTLLIEEKENLARLYCDIRRLEEAELLRKELVGFWTERCGEYDRKTLNNMRNLAITYSFQEKWREAVDQMEKVITMKLESNWQPKEGEPTIEDDLNRSQGWRLHIV